jgi:hypothetical protein
MAIGNRRQGWRRERHDLVADVRELWAEFGSKAPATSTAVDSGSTVSAAGDQADTQLATLQMVRLDCALRGFGRGEPVELAQQGTAGTEPKEAAPKTNDDVAALTAQYQRHVRPGRK